MALSTHMSSNASEKLGLSVAIQRLTFPVTGACPTAWVRGCASARVRVNRGVRYRLYESAAPHFEQALGIPSLVVWISLPQDPQTEKTFELINVMRAASGIAMVAVSQLGNIQIPPAANMAPLIHVK